jgi:hypothetical protein
MRAARGRQIVQILEPRAELHALRTGQKSAKKRLNVGSRQVEVDSHGRVIQ